MPSVELVSGMYLTDGEHLFEVVDVFPSSESIVVECCRSGKWSERLIADVIAGKWRKIVPVSGV